MKKVHRRKTPQGGWGVGSEGAYSKYLLRYLQCLRWMPMVLTDLDPKAYRFYEEDKIKSGAPGGL